MINAHLKFEVKFPMVQSCCIHKEFHKICKFKGQFSDKFFFKTDLPDQNFFSRLTCPIGQVLCIIYLPEEQMHLLDFCINYRYIINNNTKRKASPVAVLDLVKKYLVAKSQKLLKI